MCCASSWMYLRRRFKDDREGSTVTEYAMLAALVAVTISAALFGMTGEGADLWETSVGGVRDAIANRAGAP